jgi:peptide/nickel transport system substrate-binding protein
VEDRAARCALNNSTIIGARSQRSTKIEFTIIKNDAVALQALKKGDVDSYNLRPLQWTSAKQTQISFCASLRRSSTSRQAIVMLATTCASPPFNDRRVRQAMAHLMDLDRVKTTILENLAEVTTGPVLTAESAI